MENTGRVRGIKNFDYITVAKVNEKLRPIMHDVMTFVARLKSNRDNIVPTKKRKKLYFAGPWFDEEIATLYDFCERIGKYCTLVSKYDIFWPRRQEHCSPKQVFKNNVKNVKQCDTIVALISRKDVGTAFELGLAKALGKKIFLLGYDETDMLSHTNIMLAFSGPFFTIEYFAKFLTGRITDNDYISVENDWEGKE